MLVLRDAVFVFLLVLVHFASRQHLTGCPLVSDVTMSCDSHTVIPNDIASIVVALVPMCGERWPA